VDLAGLQSERDGTLFAGGMGRESERHDGEGGQTLHPPYASIGLMNRWSAYFFWFSYLTPAAVERI
jgi:hypothetical protein